MLESCRCCAAVDRLGADGNTFLQGLRLARHDKRGRSIQQRYVTVRARQSIKDTLKSRRIGVGITALQPISAGAPKTRFLRRHLEGPDIAVLKRRNEGRSGESDLV